MNEQAVIQIAQNTRKGVNNIIRDFFPESSVEHYTVPMACRCGEYVGNLTELGRRKFLIIGGMDTVTCSLFDIEQFDPEAFVDVPKREYTSISEIADIVKLVEKEMKANNILKENVAFYVYWDEVEDVLILPSVQRGKNKGTISGVFQDFNMPDGYTYAGGPVIGLMVGEGL